MALTQLEADSLLQMPKEFVDPDPLEFTQVEPMNYDRLLHSADRREQFLLTIERPTQSDSIKISNTCQENHSAGKTRSQRARTPQSTGVAIPTQPEDCWPSYAFISRKLRRPDRL
jgi:hypothetical protein